MKLAIALSFLFSTLAAQAPLDERGKSGVVEFFVVDSNGVPVKGDITFSVRQLRDGKTAREVKVGAKASLAYGTYKLTVQGSPAYPVEKIIKVKEAYQPVLIGLFVAPIELPWAGNVVRGKLPRASAERGCLSVRLVSPVAENEYADARALASGEFGFENIKPGRYLLVTFGERGICEVSPVSVFDKRTQELFIDVGSLRP
ncbi:MAG TPA: hypothetical protein VLE22_03020 [Bryobacteraceae bacterium]|nr:hypothetical protein [Bryobacteraceae bacterium]